MVQLQNEMHLSKTLCDVVGHERIAMNSDDDCNIDFENTLSFKVSFFLGAIFTLLSALISFYLDKIGPRKLVSE